MVVVIKSRTTEFMYKKRFILNKLDVIINIGLDKPSLF